MGSATDDMRRLLDDCELFVSEILQGENLSKHAADAREVLLNNFRVVYSRNPQAFPIRSEPQQDSSDDAQSSSVGRSAPSDDLSVASDYQEEGTQEFFGEITPVAAQDLSNILKQGYLEKKRRDHSFFSLEWQRRWCVLNNTIFYYFGSEKDKQQKGSFFINGYSAELMTNVRKDSKRNHCFELSAPGRRTYQFTASSLREARDWVDQINFVLKDLSSSFIPFDDEEEEEEESMGEGEEEEETYDDIEGLTTPPTPRPAPPSQASGSRGAQEGEEEEEEEDDEDIYEVLPEDGFSELEDSDRGSKSGSDYANYYQGLWDCKAEEQDELAFRRGDLIHVISKEYNIHGWWVGELNGIVGIVPKDFLHPAYIL